MKQFIKNFIPSFLISWYHFLLAFLGALIYGFPSNKIKVIGITGTKGKTTAVELSSNILKEAGHKVASISSIKFKIAQKEWKNDLKMTMPGRFKIQKFLREAVKTDCEYAVLEVTSEGILQHRQRFVDFDVVVFTNLSPEHIERHGSFEKYKESKRKLFKQCKKVHIVNLDDPNAEYFLQFDAEEKWGYGINEKLKMKNEKLQFKIQNLVQAYNCKENIGGVSFKIDSAQFNLFLMGEFNVYNALAAICVGLSQGISLETCKKALEKVKGIEGRMEIVIEEPFKIIVDYAHTPQSLKEVYENVSSFKFQVSRLICVLGAAGGGRDKWKRPKLGEIAAKYCDEIILTNEDPYDENPSEIIEEIDKGVLEVINHKSKFINREKILDRKGAIKKAISTAKPNDIVIITGKGCEPWMCVAKGKKIPWDDREIVRQKFRELKIKS